ncbi:hypothetical protein ACUNWD_07695 [Sunxiuqinia sp. A32]|uniref:hypothetical protein n=1 Tax=Sunxiuqinia sp. A32 TaxID=3461496 RepID=UPI0040459652
MELSNQKRSKKIKRTFNLLLVIILLVVLFFVWKEMDLEAIITGGVLVLVIVFSQLVSLNYFYYSSDGDDLIIRYYPLIAFFGKEYSSVEFNKKMLYHAEIKKTFLFSDLVVAIKTAKGIAEYPEISLSALSKKQIQAILSDLESMERVK